MNNLSKIFNPKSIAIIGAKPDKNSVGFGLMKNALEGKRLRKIFAVNPKRKKVMGLKCFSSVKDISNDIDLAIVAVPAPIVSQVVKECCEKKVKGIIVVSAGFSERGKEGIVLQEEVRKTVQENRISLVGPNCLGIIRPSIKLNASFAPATPKKGEIAFVSQSGAFIDSAIDRSATENYGFSCLVSYGNEADLSLCDYLEWLEKDNETKVICLYVEGIKEGKRFLELAKKITKPIVVVKAGRTEMGQKAVSSHTGSLAGSYDVYRAAFKQAKVVEADSIEEMFDIAKALSWQPKTENGIGVVTNGGGCGVLINDYAQELGVNIVSSTDVLGDALADKYKEEINNLLKREDVKGLIVAQTVQLMTEVEKNAKVIIEAKKKFPQKPIVTAFLGGEIVKKGIDIIEKNRIPNYSDPKRAVVAMNSLIKKS